MHGYEIVGYFHPTPEIEQDAWTIYKRLVHNLHLNVETKEQLIQRLCEDRIENGTVVS